MAKTLKTPQVVYTRPMAMHKNYLIRALTERPAGLQEFLPHYAGTAEEAIKQLTEAEEEWFVGKEFITDAELKRRDAAR